MICLGHCSLVLRPWVHPRHPPRAFPLGLRAPRCLGISQCEYALCRCLFGERKESSPQRRSPPRSGDTTNTVIFELVILFSFSLRLSDLRSPPSHNPSSRFQIYYSVCRFRYYWKRLRIRRRSSDTGRPSGNARGSIQCA